MQDVTSVLMHKVPSNIDIDHVKNFLLENQVNHWRIFFKLIIQLCSLIGRLDFLDENDILWILAIFKHVKRIHELRIWALSQERTVCTVHLGVENKSADLDILHDISRNLKTQFGFTEVTGTFIIQRLWTRLQERRFGEPWCGWQT